MMSITRDIGLEVFAFLFPPACLACHRVDGVHSLPLGLCSACRRKIENPQLSAGFECSADTSDLRRVLACWTYAPPFDVVIRALKFGRLEFLGRDLADGLHCFLKEQLELEIDVVVPIPLHWYRRLSRGYNQAEAIARPLAGLLGRPLVPALRRHRPTRPQVQLGRQQRDLNLRHAFAVRRRQSTRIVQRHVLLVDDVVTTGATLQAAASSLRRAGAGSIVALTAGRTPKPTGD